MTHIDRDLRLSGREEAILKAVVYSSLFEYPLTARELSYSLIGKELSPAQVVTTYEESPSLQSVIGLENGFFYRRDCPDHLQERCARTRTTRDILSRHSRILTLIAHLPFTRLVAVSGSAAHLNMTPGADVDLFIVTRAGRVWGTAAAILALSRILGCRRVICFNYLISEERLAVEGRDLFTANQIIHLRSLSGDETLRRLRGENPWVKDFYPGGEQPGWGLGALFSGSESRGRGKRLLEILLSLGPAQLLESLSHRFYRRYLVGSSRGWATPGAVTLSRSVMKLHTSSHAQEVLRRFEADLKLLRSSLGGQGQADSPEKPSPPRPPQESPTQGALDPNSNNSLR